LELRHDRGRALVLSGMFLCVASGLAQPSFAQSGTPSSPSTPGQAISGTGGVSPFAGSVPEKPVPGSLPLSLQGAIDRALRQNLGALLSNADIRSARGQRWEQLSALLPHVDAAPYVTASEINLGELGLSGFGGIKIPTSVGPFAYFDARFAVTQTVFDWKAISAARASRQSVKSAEYSYKDARDLVVLAVGYTYLQAIADEARIETAEAQVKTAQALYDQASDQVSAGTSPEIDGLRAKVELQTRQQQLIQAQNTFAIQKLTLARVIGLSPGQQFELTDKSPYQPFEMVTVDEALKRAYASRSDYQAAMTDVRGAEFSRKSARRRDCNHQRDNEGNGPRKIGAVHRQRLPLGDDVYGGGKRFNDFLQGRVERRLLC